MFTQSNLSQLHLFLLQPFYWSLSWSQLMKQGMWETTTVKTVSALPPTKTAGYSSPQSSSCFKPSSPHSRLCTYNPAGSFAAATRGIRRIRQVIENRTKSESQSWARPDISPLWGHRHCVEEIISIYLVEDFVFAKYRYWIPMLGRGGHL